MTYVDPTAFVASRLLVEVPVRDAPSPAGGTRDAAQENDGSTSRS